MSVVTAAEPPDASAGTGSAVATTVAPAAPYAVSDSTVAGDGDDPTLCTVAVNRAAWPTSGAAGSSVRSDAATARSGRAATALRITTGGDGALALPAASRATAVNALSPGASATAESAKRPAGAMRTASSPSTVRYPPLPHASARPVRSETCAAGPAPSGASVNAPPSAAR